MRLDPHAASWPLCNSINANHIHSLMMGNARGLHDLSKLHPQAQKGGVRRGPRQGASRVLHGKQAATCWPRTAARGLATLQHAMQGGPGAAVEARLLHLQGWSKTDLRVKASNSKGVRAVARLSQGGA